MREPRDFADAQLSQVPCTRDSQSSVFGPSFGAQPPALRVVATRATDPDVDRGAAAPVHKGYPAPPPISFPDPEQLLREREQRARAERSHDAEVFGQRQRLADSMRDARNEARAEGYRCGYTRGTHWGIWCGAIGGTLLGMIAGVCLVELGMGWPL